MTNIKLFLLVTYISCVSVSASQLSKSDEESLAWKLHTAILENSIQGAREAIDAGANLNGGKNLAPLRYAVRLGNIEIVNLLLDRGADINEQDTFGVTALLAVAENLNKEMVFALLERGADRSAGQLRNLEHAPQEIKEIFEEFDKKQEEKRQKRKKQQEKYSREKVEPSIVQSIQEVIFPPELAGEVAEYADIEMPEDECEEKEKKSNVAHSKI